MPPSIRRLMLVGIVLTAIGLLGLAITAGNPGASRELVRYVFIPGYLVGAALLIGAGVWWLVTYMRK